MTWLRIKVVVQDVPDARMGRGTTMRILEQEG